VTVGEDGFLFLNASPGAPANRNFEVLCQDGVREDLRDTRLAELRRLQAAYARRGYELAIGLAPTKPVVYPERLGPRVPRELREACLAYRDSDPLLAWLDRESRRSGLAPVHYPLSDYLAQRNRPLFYPRNNFHWNGASSHLFARSLLERLGFTLDPAYGADPEQVTVTGDMRVLGFRREIQAWEYPDDHFGVSRQSGGAVDRLSAYYQRANDFSVFTTQRPMSEERVLILSNSFGRRAARDLAPGFSTLFHVNITFLQDHEYPRFFTEFIDSLDVDRVIFIVHDQAMVRGWKVDEMLQALESAH
jgi:hypothetical protein